MPSFLRTRAARRWLTWLSAILGVVGIVGLGGGFEARTHPAPPEYAVGQEVETSRFTYTVTGAEWAPANEEGENRLSVRFTVLNTSQDTDIVNRWLLFVRLPDRTVLPLESDTLTWLAKDGPGRYLPDIETPATLSFVEGVPAEMPGEVTVIIFDERLNPGEGVYSEWWEPGDVVAQVHVPVTEGRW